MRPQDLSIRGRLLVAFFLVCFLFVIANFISAKQNRVVAEKTRSNINEVYPNLINFLEIQKDVIQIQQWLTDISATRAAEGYDDGFTQAETYYMNGLKRMEWAIAEHEKYGQSETITTLKDLKISFEAYYSVGREMAKAYIEGGPEKGNPKMETFDPFSAKLTEQIDAIVAGYEREQKNGMQQILTSLHKSNRVLLMATIIAFITASILAFFLSRTITVPIAELITHIKELEKGNLSLVIDMDRKDELGQIASSLNNLTRHDNQSIKSVRSVSSTITGGIHLLTDLYNAMAGAANQVSIKTNSVATAVRQMEGSVQSIYGASEQISVNVNMVAAAAEEMSTTVSEIAANADNAISITKEAVAKSTQAGKNVKELGAAASEISQVTETINEIADQTNLLALNATIEAARAGDAGKGFAVVAHEIKELAQQTGKAANKIKERIEGVQTSSELTVEVINSIDDTIVKTNEIVLAMATAVQEQVSVSREIAENVSQASDGIKGVNGNLAQTSKVNGEIARDIYGIDEDSDGVEVNCRNVNDQISELQLHAQTLKDIIQGYTLKSELFDIGAVKSAHFNWKINLSSVLSGFKKMSSTEVPDHHTCAFGKWFDTIPDELRQYTVCKEIDKQHKAVQRTVKEAIDLYNNNHSEAAQKKVAEFEEIRIKLFAALDELYMQE